ncbi:MAG: HAD-IA family hydrolase [bacterium]
MTLQALIFDVDGTLAETEEVHRQAFNDIFQEDGLDWHWSRNDYCKLLNVTGGKERIRHYIKDWLKEDPNAVDIPDMHQRKTARYVEIMNSGTVQLRPGVERLIEEALSAKIQCAIATTTSLPNVEVLIHNSLGAAGLNKFSAIAAGDQVKAKKPAPDVYLLALERLDLAARECFALEDSENGLISAQRAQLPTLVTTNDYTAHHQFNGAVAVLDSLGDADNPVKYIAGSKPDQEMVTLHWLQQMHNAIS